MTDARDDLRDLNALLAAVCDQTAGPEDIARLESLAADDADRLDYVLDYLRLDGLLRWEYGAGATAGVEPATDRGAAIAPALVSAPPIVLDVSPAEKSSWFAFRSPVGGVLFSYALSALIVALGLLVCSIGKISYDRSHSGPKPDAVANHAVPAAPMVGRVSATADCRLAGAAAPVVDLAPVPQGQRYALDSGFLELSYDSGAKVLLEGPCVFVADSPDGGYLVRGRLTARIVATGHRPLTTFAIRTPTAIVTDLGTEFGVEVDEAGRTRSHVFVGAVKVQRRSAKGAVGSGTMVRAGQSVQAAKDGDIVVSKNPDGGRQFTRRIQPRRAGPSEIVETFDRPTLGTAFDQMPPDAFENVVGAALYRQPIGVSVAKGGMQSRGYIRTRAADFRDCDFTAEAIVRVRVEEVDKKRRSHRVYFGIGDGVPNADYCDEVLNGLVLCWVVDDGSAGVVSCRPTAHLARSMAGEKDASNATLAEVAPRGAMGADHYRFRMTKMGDTVVFAVDVEARGAYREQLVGPPLNLRTAAPTLGATNGRVFVGAGNCDTVKVRIEELRIREIRRGGSRPSPKSILSQEPGL